MTPSETLKLVALMQGAFPRTALPDSTLEVYAEALGDLAFDDAKAAVVRLVQRSRFMPTIAEIRDEVFEDRCELPDPEVAWGEVRRAIQRIGPYYEPVFECAEIDQAVRVVGWQTLNDSTNIASERARFIDAYRAIRRRRMELEVTGRYEPAPRTLPRITEGYGHGHGAQVLVRSSAMNNKRRTAIPGGHPLKLIDDGEGGAS